MTGIVALPEVNRVVSVSDSGLLVVAEISSGEEVQSVYPSLENSKYALKSLAELPGRQAIVATDISGKIYIFSYADSETGLQVIT